MRSVADFLDVDIPESRWPAIVEHCSFDWMKSHAEQVTPLGGAIFEGGAGVFINRGTNGRWKDVLTPEDSADYERMAVEKLGADCAHWLMTGERG